jgi:hypothetical protein
MHVTVRFGNIFYIVLYSAALLAIGCSIGVRWGHSASAGWLLFAGVLLLLAHDATMTLALAIVVSRMTRRNR